MATSQWYIPQLQSLARLQDDMQCDPLWRDLRPKRLRPEADVQALPPPARTAAPCILIVDHNQATRQAVAELLREHEYSVYMASGMQEMECVCRNLAQPPELVLLEFRLRDGRGDLAAAWLRACWPDVFILYFSCVHPDDDPALRSALLAPATALLFKPTSLEAILQVLHAIHPG